MDIKKIGGIAIIMLVFLWPFSCTPQSPIKIGGDGCDTVYIESPEIDKQFQELTDMIEQLTDQNALCNESLSSAMSTITTLTAELEACNNRPPEIVRDTVYVDKIVEVVPEPQIDTVTVTHCSEETKNTTWFHHGSIAGYPHDISFATKELSIIRVHFKDSLTNEFKVQDSYKLKRTKDFEKARTLYEFIE
jgi:hypothetical protein